MERARIAVVQGASNATIQDIFSTLADRWATSARLAGLLAEKHGLADRACSAGFLRNIRTGERFPIFQDLGPGSTTCHIDGAAMLPATEAVQRDIAAGCDLVLLSKFGKLEAANSGLAGAFRAAIEADIPVLTSISPAHEAAWLKFATAPFVTLPADPTEIETWWQAVRLPVARECDRQKRITVVIHPHTNRATALRGGVSFRTAGRPRQRNSTAVGRVPCEAGFGWHPTSTVSRRMCVRHAAKGSRQTPRGFRCSPASAGPPAGGKKKCARERIRLPTSRPSSYLTHSELY